MDIPKEKLRDLESFFAHIPQHTAEEYIGYWSDQIPTNSRQRWQKWIFAVSSIHTGWENNVAQYNALKDLNGSFTQSSIAEHLRTGGMHNRKAKVIGQICDNRAYDMLPASNNWETWRDYHRDKLWGIGNAKISFAAELINPIKSTIICIDRHILHAFGQDKEKAPKLDEYLEMEDIWKYLSSKVNIPPALTRFIYWDCYIQNKSNSKYWSHVLE